MEYDQILAAMQLPENRVKEHIDAKLDPIIEKQKEVRQTLYGNGKAGLKDDVTKIKQTISNAKWLVGGGSILAIMVSWVTGTV